jgi:hypothetical protein
MAAQNDFIDEVAAPSSLARPASLSSSADIYLNVLNNSYDRMYL